MEVYDGGEAVRAEGFDGAGETAAPQGGIGSAGTDGGDWTVGEAGAEWGADDTPDAAADQPPEERFLLKHLGDEIEVGRDEMVRLAQKGRDYDRIRRRADTLSRRVRESEEHSEALRTVAAREGMTAEQYVDHMAAQALAREAGVSEEEAGRKVRAERARRSFPGAEETTAGLVRDRETAEFMREYGGVDPAGIPAEVWDDVKRGRSLLDAYRAHENRELNRRLSDMRRDGENARRAMGSRASDGSGFGGEIEHDWRYGD